MAAFADFYDLPRNVASLLIHHYCMVTSKILG